MLSSACSCTYVGAVNDQPGTRSLPRIALTERFAAHARPQDGQRQTDYWDETADGLILRVSESKKVWNFLSAMPDGTRPRVDLGTYPATSVAMARGLAIEARGCLDRGEDPRALFGCRNAGAQTVSGLIDRYLDMYVRRHLRSASEVERRLRKNVVPVIGDVRVSELHRRDINRVIDPIVSRDAPVEAARVYEDVLALTRWALARGELDRDPTLGLRRPPAKPPRDRVLSDAEIRVLWTGLPHVLARSRSCQRIIKLALLTAQRVGEICGMRVDELDLVRGTWSIPGARTKNKRGHSVPLSQPAIAVVEEALAEAGEGAQLVFPSNGGSLPPMAVAKAIERAQSRFGLAHWTAHDLRRSALTGMARLGVAPITLAHIANHRTGTKAGMTLSVYVHDDHSAQKASALALWAQRLEGIVSGGAAVVSLRGAQ